MIGIYRWAVSCLLLQSLTCSEAGKVSSTLKVNVRTNVYVRLDVSLSNGTHPSPPFLTNLCLSVSLSLSLSLTHTHTTITAISLAPQRLGWKLRTSGSPLWNPALRRIYRTESNLHHRRPLLAPLRRLLLGFALHPHGEPWRMLLCPKSP